MPTARKPTTGLGATTRYRYGMRTTETRQAHAVASTAWRRQLAEAEFPPAHREELLEQVANGVSVRLAAERLGTSHQAVYAWAARDPAFAAELDTAQRAAASPDTPHGTESGYRHWNCRCGDCRAAHAR